MKVLKQPAPWSTASPCPARWKFPRHRHGLDAAKHKGRPYDGVVALGCVIRGDTIHFEIVSQLSAQGLLDLSVARGLPIGNGIVTVNTLTQAFARARLEEQDKGGDAARAALAMVRLKRRLARGKWQMARAATNQDRKANKRGVARLAAVQALYQMDLAGTGLNDILAEFESHWLDGEVEGAQYRPAEAAFFRDIVGGVVREQGTLDPLIDAALARGWPLKRIETVLRGDFARRRLRTGLPARCAGARRHLGICRCRRRLRRARTRPAWSTRCSINWRARLRGEELRPPATSNGG